MALAIADMDCKFLDIGDHIIKLDAQIMDVQIIRSEHPNRRFGTQTIDTQIIELGTQLIYLGTQAIDSRAQILATPLS